MKETIQMKHHVVWEKIQTPSYMGFCPICSNRSLRSVAFNAGFENIFYLIECTVCYSHSRHRLLHIYLKNIFDKYQPTINFLHFAPEYSLTNLVRSYPNINYLSVDLNIENAMQMEDITNLSFEDNTFDFMLNVHVLEHIEDDQKAYSEMFRVLKPGGVALIDVPMGDLKRHLKTYEDPTITDPAERTKHFGQLDHVRVYGRDIIRRIKKSGFEVCPIFLYESLSVRDKIKFGLYRQFAFLCFKPTENQPFSIYQNSLFKALPNKEVLNILGENNGYIIDVSGPGEIVIGEETLFTSEYLIYAPKKLFIGIIEEESKEAFLLTKYLDITPEKDSIQFNLLVDEKLAKDKSQLYLLVRIIEETPDQYEIIDEVILTLKTMGKINPSQEGSTLITEALNF